MKKNEKKFSTDEKLPSRKTVAVPEDDPSSRTESTIRNESTPQRSLDRFLKPKTTIFDDSFSMEDFQLITQRWLEKNANVLVTE
jgi:hypothetical protein